MTDNSISRREFGNRLSELMRKNGHTQLSLSKELDVSNASVCGWVHGKSFPSTEKMARLAELFNVPLDSLLSYKTEVSKPDAENTVAGKFIRKLYDRLDSKHRTEVVFNYYSDDWNFREKLKHFLSVRGYSVPVVASRVGVHEKTLNEWIEGTKEPTVSQLAKLCDCLEVSMDRLAYSRCSVTLIQNAGLSLNDIDLIKQLAEVLRRNRQDS